MQALLAAIVEDDIARVTALLADNGALVSQLVDFEKLYDSRIFHWLYVGDTPLHLASAGYRVRIVKLLITAGADPNSVRNRRRSSPLHYAADGYVSGPDWDPKRQVETLKVLLSAGADLHAQDQNGATALHRAVRTRCAAAVVHLLSAGSDPTRRNKSGSTPFHLAVQNTGRGGSGEQIAREGQRQIVEAFLSFGVSVGLTDGKGRTVMDSAKSEWLGELLTQKKQ